MPAPKTAQEILAEWAAKISADIGLTALSAPATYPNDPIVYLMSLAACSQAGMEMAAENVFTRLNPENNENDALDVVGGMRGIPRKTGTFSKTNLIITGELGAVIPAGFQLTDKLGATWSTTSAINITISAGGCYIGIGTACADVSGDAKLEIAELSAVALPSFAYSATNGAMIEIGGALESDDVYRARLLNRLPLSNVSGTTDATLAQILEISGVTFARQVIVTECGEQRPMFVVGGVYDQPAVCSAISDNASLTCSALAGDYECADECTEIRYQPACPVLIKIRVITSCECPAADESAITSAILSRDVSIALRGSITVRDIVTAGDGILSAEFCVYRKPLYGCEPSTFETITDPIDGNLIDWWTDSYGGYCSGGYLCDLYSRTACIQSWEYPIISSDYIEFVKDCCEENDARACC